MTAEFGASHGLTLLAFILASSLVIVAPAVGQAPSVEDVQVHVQPAADGSSALVQADFRLRKASTADTIPLSALEFFGIELSEVRVSVGNNPATVAIDRSRAPAVSVGLIMPASTDTADVRISIHYTASGALRRETGDVIDAAVPLFLPRATAGDPRDDFFRATITLPSSQSLFETFPTVPRTVSLQEEVTSYTIQLQAAPSLLRWRSREGNAPLFPFGRLVDLFTVLALGGLGIVAFRVLRSS